MREEGGSSLLVRASHLGEDGLPLGRAGLGPQLEQVLRGPARHPTDVSLPQAIPAEAGEGPQQHMEVGHSHLVGA